jgi:lipase chaperone LimK
VGASGEGDLVDDAALQPGIAASVIPPAIQPDLQAMTPDQIKARLFEQGALAGTVAADEWCVQAGALKPCLALRKRFEVYIEGAGGASAADLRKLVADDAFNIHGEPLAGEIMAIWDKYWALRNHVWRIKMEPGELRTWMPAFEEQRQTRQRLLGPEWAEAFFAEEDRQFKAYFEKLQTGRAPDPVRPQ